MKRDVEFLEEGTIVVTKATGCHDHASTISFPSEMHGKKFEIISGHTEFRVRYVNWVEDSTTRTGSWAVHNYMIDWEATERLNMSVEDKIAEMTL